jgi:hypothetical protein
LRCRRANLAAGRPPLATKRLGAQVLAYVDALIGDKSLPKAEGKREQVEHAAHAAL